MLTGEYTTVQESFIWVDRANRARKVITEEAVQEKMESISRIGLIHPLVITRQGQLVAGETRLTALRRLGWTGIPIQWSDEMDPRELMKIEFEENFKRTDLLWQDQCDFLRRFHAMCLEDDPNWTQENTAEAMGVVQETISKYLLIAEAVTSGDQRVAAAKEFSTALGIAKRVKERKAHDELSMLKVSLGDDDAESMEVEQPVAASPILNVDFLEWAEHYEGMPFNLIHCDFPYGINADKFNQGAADAYGGYEDSPEVYWALVDGLIKHREKLMGRSAHIIFWFSMKWYTETLAKLQQHFWVDPYPLVWVKSDNKGTLPDPQRGPRRIYEVAFLCSHGDRKIISPVSNTFAAPTVRTGEHMSEKNEDMLAFFMKMMVDDNTRLLDPTCGSGSALRAASRLNAASVLGLEKDPEFAENARRAYLASRVG